MTPIFKLTSAALALGVLMGVAACDQTPSIDEAAAFPASENVYPFAVGAVQLAALRDGDLTVPLEQSPWGAGSEVRAALVEAGQSGDAVHLSIQPLLLRDGDRIVLIDTGAGGQMGTANGLPGALLAAGVAPEQVTDILISHAHGDHVGGLLNAEGGLAYPNAVIRFSAAEWAAAQAGADAVGAGPLVAAITPRVETFEPGARLTPSITAVALDGHTAGHTGYEIASGGDRLLYVGDAMHSSVISVGYPEIVNAWDIDSPTAFATRQGLIERGEDGGLRYYGIHFPFPGLGRIVHDGQRGVWMPEAPASAD